MRTNSTNLFMSSRRIVETDNDWQFPYLDEETFAALTGDWEHSDAVLLDGAPSMDSTMSDAAHPSRWPWDSSTASPVTSCQARTIDLNGLARLS